MAGRIALVTGGTRGIGAAICSRLKDRGYFVIANYYKTPEDAESFRLTRDIPCFSWDVRDLNQCMESCQKIQDLYGPIEILVHNAGITRDALLHKMAPDMWEDVIRTNLSSCFYLSRCVVPKMQEVGFGRLVFISSINGIKGQRGQTNYAAAKAGMIGFVKSLAQENVHKGITVNAVAPGYTDTEMVRKIPENVLNHIIEQIPMGRLAHPFEIARCVSFFLEDDAGYITGQTLHVNGGQLMV